MASEEPKTSILDLLYDDELDEETREQTRRDVEASEEARRELEEYESMLGMIRESVPSEDVSDSVHDSIMAQAREHAAKSASRKAQVTDRPPAPSRSSEQSLWARVNSSGVGQLVLAATVLLAVGAVFLLYTVGDTRQEKFTAAHDSVDSEVTFGEAPTGQMARAPEQAEPRAEQAPAEPAQEPARAEEAEPEPDSKESELGELAKLDQSERVAEKKERSRAKPKRRPRSSRKSKSASSADKKGDVIDLFSSSSKSRSDKSRKKARPKPSQPTSGVEALAEANAGPEREEAAEAEGGISDSSELGDFARGSIDADDGASAETKPEASKSEAQSQAEEGPSVSSMETSYASGNYDDVVDQADRYLSSGSGAQTSEARVLELKARALTRQGKSSQADSVYAELQKKYPSYKSDEIRTKRQELAKERRPAAKRRMRPESEEAPAKKSAPAETDIPAPASMDKGSAY